MENTKKEICDNRFDEDAFIDAIEIRLDYFQSVTKEDMDKYYELIELRGQKFD